jgi:hypothetical protein
MEHHFHHDADPHTREHRRSVVMLNQGQITASPADTSATERDCIHSNERKQSPWHRAPIPLTDL